MATKKFKYMWDDGVMRSEIPPQSWRELNKSRKMGAEKYLAQKNKGWVGESARHSMSRYGIKTGNKKHIYLYSNKVKTIKSKNGGFAVQKFTVYKVPVTNKDAELQARVIAKKRKDTLAGGLFYDETKPYDFKENYKVVNVPASTPESKPTAHDKFIENIISYESGEATPEQEKKLFKHLKKSGIGKHLQGHYSSRM